MTDIHQAKELKAVGRLYEDRAAYYNILARIYGYDATLVQAYRQKADQMRAVAHIFRTGGDSYVESYGELHKRLESLNVDMSDPMSIPDLFAHTIEVECDCDGECGGPSFE